MTVNLLIENLTQWATSFDKESIHWMLDNEKDQYGTYRKLGEIIGKRAKFDPAWYFAVANLVPESILELSQFIGQIELYGYAFPPTQDGWREWLSELSAFEYHCQINPWKWGENGICTPPAGAKERQEILASASRGFGEYRGKQYGTQVVAIW